MNWMRSGILLGYIDPGAGAMLLQWIIAAVLGTGLLFRRTIAHAFSRLFRGKKKQEEGDD